MRLAAQWEIHWKVEHWAPYNPLQEKSGGPVKYDKFPSIEREHQQIDETLRAATADKI